MNYLQIYEDLILKAKTENRKKLKRGNPDYVYYENHHIIPKCLDGDNSKENLVLLTGKEHFIAHKLLVEIFPDNKGIFWAFFMMFHKNDKNHGRNYRISSREYERVKIKNSENLVGVKHSEETKEKIRKAALKFRHSEETKKKLSEIKTGKKLSEKHREKLRGKRKPLSQEIKDKISDNNSMKLKENRDKVIKGLKKYYSDCEYIVCPHCKFKSKNYSAMQFWHFDNCTKNPNFNKDNLIECVWCGKTSRNRAAMLNKHFDNCYLNPNLTKEEVNALKIKNSQSEESREKLKLAWKNKPILTCPYCGKQSKNKGNMNRYHFDNCKLNK